MTEHLAFLFDLSGIPLWGLICLISGSLFTVLAWGAWLWANHVGYRTGGCKKPGD